MVGALVGDRDLGAQLVEAEPLGEIGRLGRSAVEEVGRARFGRNARHQHIEQNLALGRKQRGIAGLARTQPPDVVGQKALQETGRVLAGDAHHAAIVEQGGFLRHGGSPVALAMAGLVN